MGSQSVKSTQRRGFTLIELLVALMVIAVVLTAAATMAGALSSGKAVVEQTGRDSAYLMQLQNRMSDLIMRANGVLSADAQKIVLWHDLDCDRAGVDSEYTTIEVSEMVQLVIYNNHTPDTKEIYPKCSNVQFWADNADCGQIRNITVKWDMVEGGISQAYSICGTLRGKE